VSRIHYRSVWLACAIFSVSFIRVEAALVAPPVLTMDPNGTTPLAGQVMLSTDVPSRVTLKISEGSDVRRVRFPKRPRASRSPLWA
jgi:hypothetical protein